MPKLTLCDLLAVVTIMALALGWWPTHVRRYSPKFDETPATKTTTEELERVLKEAMIHRNENRSSEAEARL
jgi:hypothetical protein